MQQPQHNNPPRPPRPLRPAPARVACREARRRKRLSLTAGGVAAAAAAAMAVSAITGSLRQQEAVETAAASDIEGVQSLPAQGGTAGIEPADDSRYHRLARQACQPYAVPVENELGFHALRHGAVWVTYHPNLPADEIRRLEELAAEYDAVLLTPSPGPGEPVTARAWNVRLNLPSADDERIEPFILKYANNPRRPEASASCNARD